jgi:hypothetical protein
MLCECGCGENVLGGFKPGHDQKLRIALEQRVGGLLALRSLVDAAERLTAGHSQSELIDKVRAVFLSVKTQPGQRDDGKTREITKDRGAPASPYRNESGSMSDDHIG